MSKDTTVSVYARVQDPLGFCQQFGLSLAKSQMFGCSNPEQGQVMAMACLCEGISPVEVAKKYHIIQGRLTKKADAMLAEFREAGGKHKIIERTPNAAEIELTKDGETQRFRLTFEEAQQEKFPFGKDGKTLKDNWATPRGRMQMLWARVASDGVRCMAPEVNAGTYTPEEMRDVFGDGVNGSGGGFAGVNGSNSVNGTGSTVAQNQPEGEAQVIDAEYEVVPTSEQSHPVTSQVVQQASPPAGEEPLQVEVIGEEVTNGDGFATREQLQRIKDLIVELRMPYEVQEQAKAKRGVNSWRNLTDQQAAEFIAVMETKLPPKS